VPDGLGGFGLAAKIAMESVPDKGQNPWGAGQGWGGARQDGEPDMHGFEGGFWGGDRCKYPGCGQPRNAHPNGDEGPEPRGNYRG